MLTLCPNRYPSSTPCHEEVAYETSHACFAHFFPAPTETQPNNMNGQRHTHQHKQRGNERCLSCDCNVRKLFKLRISFVTMFDWEYASFFLEKPSGQRYVTYIGRPSQRIMKNIHNLNAGCRSDTFISPR